VAEQRRRHPGPGELTGEDQRALEASRAAFAPSAGTSDRSQQKAAITEAMRVVGEANKYLSDQAPWKLKDDPARRDSVLHVALQLVDDAKALLTPFLPGVLRHRRPDARRRPPVGGPAGAARGRGPRRRDRATRC
jgi:methionyl-tRNA synthetase